MTAAARGLRIGNACAPVIYAMQFIPAAYAVAFTNAGIVLAGVIAMVCFRERGHWPARLAAMVVICIGLALLALRGCPPSFCRNKRASLRFDTKTFV